MEIPFAIVAADGCRRQCLTLRYAHTSSRRTFAPCDRDVAEASASNTG